ncbi:MAG: complement resistance protein TraT [Deltaproteobacteria bacterium]|jgi:hypothetical protein|nr:complement resistance protein TraT [Deltaproteobacteria bacterium]
MPSPSQRVFQALLLLTGLLAAGCAGRADPPAGAEQPAPPITLSAEAERSVCMRIRNDSGAQVALHAPLVSKIRRKNYEILQDCGRAGYVLDIEVHEIRRGDAAEYPDSEEDWGGALLGLGLGSGLGGHGGTRVGLGLGFAVPIGTRRLPSFPAYTYTMITGLEIEEATPHARVRQRTRLLAAAPAPSEAAALPRLEEYMAEAISAILP